MKKYLLSSIGFAILILVLNIPAKAQDITAKEVIDKANELMRGKSSQGVMTMKIIRPKWERTLSFKTWSKGTEYSLIYVTAPAKEKGQVFLKREKEMWNWVPTIERMIKIPPSMMMQSWMGSDMTNDDLVKESSIVEDYDHQITGSETIEGYDCHIIELIPHEDAAVVWGKEVLVIRDDFVLLEQQYWDQDNNLVKSMKALEIKVMDDRPIASIMRMQSKDSPDEWTELRTIEIEFDIELPSNLFTLSSLRNPRL